MSLEANADIVPYESNCLLLRNASLMSRPTTGRCSLYDLLRVVSRRKLLIGEGGTPIGAFVSCSVDALCFCSDVLLTVAGCAFILQEEAWLIVYINITLTVLCCYPECI
jgi:hypothetical protein